MDPLLHPYEIPYPDAHFDVVLSFGVLEHTPYDDKSMTELYRILKPGGLLFVFNLPYYLSWTQRLSRATGDDYHDRLYTKDRVSSLASESGFFILDCWFRQLLPKNSINYPCFRTFERMDQWLTSYTFLKFFATSIEFVALKPHP